jgi:hypothetical protein
MHVNHTLTMRTRQPKIDDRRARPFDHLAHRWTPCVAAIAHDSWR